MGGAFELEGPDGGGRATGGLDDETCEAAAEVESARTTGAGLFAAGAAFSVLVAARADVASKMPGSGSPKDGPAIGSVFTASTGDGLRDEVNKGVGRFGTG